MKMEIQQSHGVEGKGKRSVYRCTSVPPRQREEPPDDCKAQVVPYQHAHHNECLSQDATNESGGGPIEERAHTTNTTEAKSVDDMKQSQLRGMQDNTRAFLYDKAAATSGGWRHEWAQPVRPGQQGLARGRRGAWVKLGRGGCAFRNLLGKCPTGAPEADPPLPPEGNGHFRGIFGQGVARPWTRLCL